MIPQLLGVGLWLLAAHLTVQKHGIEAMPLMVFLFIIVILGSAGSASVDA